MSSLGRIMGDLRILIVDDHTFLCGVLADLMRGLGAYHSQTASDGGAAIQKIPTFKPDLIITDLCMKPMNGIELSKWIRLSPDSPDREIPIIMVTGEADMDAIRKARDMGVNEFVAKPVVPKQILARLQSVLLEPREFIREQSYFGPDRRRRDDPAYTGSMRRATDQKLSQTTKTAEQGIRTLVLALVQSLGRFDPKDKASLNALLASITHLKKLAIASDNQAVTKAIISLQTYVSTVQLSGILRNSLLRQHLECIAILSDPASTTTQKSQEMLDNLAIHTNQETAKIQRN